MKIAINGEILEVSGGGALPEGTVAVKPLTQAEYDALTDDEKQADVVYAITDDAGGSGGGSSEFSLDVYSTEETRIGTWVNGQPIYRKSLTAVLPSSITNGVSVQVASLSLDMDVLVHGYGSITTTANQELSLSHYINESDYAVVLYNKANSVSAQNTLRLVVSSNFASCRLRYTLEYTKTTDTGGAA